MMIIIMVITRIIEQMIATIPKMKLIIIFVIKTDICCLQQNRWTCKVWFITLSFFSQHMFTNEKKNLRQVSSGSGESTESCICCSIVQLW